MNRLFVIIPVLLAFLFEPFPLSHDENHFDGNVFSSMETDAASFNGMGSTGNDNPVSLRSFDLLQMDTDLSPAKSYLESAESKRKRLYNLMTIKRGHVIDGSLRM